jgi:hypothetical protein
VMAWMGETMTGHQKGRSRQPSDSAPFWRSMKRAGMFWACWSGGYEPDFAAFVGVNTPF